MFPWLMPESTPCFTCFLWTDVIFTHFSLVKQAKFVLVVGILMIVSGRASASFKQDVSYLFCLKAFIIIIKYFLLHKEWILHHFKFCILCLHLLASQHGKRIHNDIICKLPCRRDLMIWAIRCGEKNIPKNLYLYGLSAKLVIKYWYIGYQQKNHTCIPNRNVPCLHIRAFWFVWSA